jgi:hypothetical protein
MEEVMKRVITTVIIAGTLLAGITSAATIDGIFSGNAAATNTYDLTTLGAVDWVYWDETGATSLPGDPTNEKSGGSLISDMYGVGTSSSVRGPSSRAVFPTMSFRFTDGTATLSGIVTNSVGMFNTTSNVESNGVGLVIDLPTTNTYQVTIFVAGYGGVAGRFTASLSGAADYDNTDFQDVAGGNNDSAFYTLFVTADAAGDDLAIEFIQVSTNSNYEIVIINGVAVSLAPPAYLEGNFSGNASATGIYSLTALGSEDWVYWHTGSSGGTPSNDKLGGSLISDAFIVGTGTGMSRPSTSLYNTTLDFTYTEGASPASGTVSKPSGVYNTEPNLVGEGVGLTINLPTDDTYIVSVFVAGYNGEGKFTAYLPGAPQYVNTEFLDGAVPSFDKDSAVYTLTATPRTAGDDLTVEFVLNKDTAAYDYLILVGAAVRLAPPGGTVIVVY